MAQCRSGFLLFFFVINCSWLVVEIAVCRHMYGGTMQPSSVRAANRDGQSVFESTVHSVG